MSKRKLSFQGQISDEALPKPLTTDSSPPKRMKHSRMRGTPWFSDGNVIVEADDVHFKVHRDVLARHSQTLADSIFAQLSAPDVPQLDGCPIVYLAEPARDVEYVLRELYYLRVHQSNELPTFDYLFAMLRLGTAWSISPMCNSALTQLQRCFTTKLDQYTNVNAPQKVFRASDITHHVELLNLAEELQFQTIMPVLFYQCRVSTEEAMMGVTRDDGRTVKLSRGNEQRLLIGRERLRDTLRTETYAWMVESVPECSRGRACTIVKTERLVIALGKKVEDAYCFLKWWPAWGETLCTACAERAKETHERCRRKLWEELPGIWGLAPWEALSNDAERGGTVLSVNNG